MHIRYIKASDLNLEMLILLLFKDCALQDEEGARWSRKVKTGHLLKFLKLAGPVQELCAHAAAELGFAARSRAPDTWKQRFQTMTAAG